MIGKILRILTILGICLGLVACMLLFTGCRQKSAQEIETELTPLIHFESEDEQVFWTHAYSVYMHRSGVFNIERTAVSVDKMLLEYRKRKLK